MVFIEYIYIYNIIYRIYIYIVHPFRNLNSPVTGHGLREAADCAAGAALRAAAEFGMVPAAAWLGGWGGGNGGDGGWDDSTKWV